MLQTADSCIYMHHSTMQTLASQTATKLSVYCSVRGSAYYAIHLMGYHTCFVSSYVFVT